jgi:hypothetical protein
VATSPLGAGLRTDWLRELHAVHHLGTQVTREQPPCATRRQRALAAASCLPHSFYPPPPSCPSFHPAPMASGAGCSTRVRAGAGWCRRRTGGQAQLALTWWRRVCRAGCRHVGCHSNPSPDGYAVGGVWAGLIPPSNRAEPLRQLDNCLVAYVLAAGEAASGSTGMVAGHARAVGACLPPLSLSLSLFLLSLSAPPCARRPTTTVPDLCPNQTYYTTGAVRQPT